MRWGSLLLSLLFSGMLLTGCGESETVKEIRTARKAGDPVRALDLAKASLYTDPDQMDVWCQLAYANLDVVRLTEAADDPFIYVIQSAMMCAALNEYGGKLPKDWQALQAVLRGQLIAKTRSTLNQIDDSHREAQELLDKRLEEGYFDRFPRDVREQMIEDYKKEVMKISSQPLVDPRIGRAIVWETSCYAELLTMLSDADREDVKVTLDFIDRTLGEWPTYSELDPSFITDVRAEAVKTTAQVYQTLLNDLKQSDHFTVQNVLKMDILP